MKYYLLSLFLTGIVLVSFAEDKGILKLSFKNLPCDFDFIRTVLEFSDFVRDQKDADIYIVFNKMDTGSGGKKYIAEFQGQHEFSDLKETLHFYCDKSATEQQIRSKTLKII